MPSQVVWSQIQNIFLLMLLASLICTKRTWTCVSHVFTLRLWIAVKKRTLDDKPTNIYVNRRTPSCSLFEFSRFECARQKRVRFVCSPVPAVLYGSNYFWMDSILCSVTKESSYIDMYLKSATIIQYTIKGRFMSR